MATDDPRLVRVYAGGQSEQASKTLGESFTYLAYATALRQVCGLNKDAPKKRMNFCPRPAHGSDANDFRRCPPEELGEFQ
jgi:hypothetical protein